MWLEEVNKMPTGLAVMQWNERLGAKLLGQFPEQISIQEKTLMQLYTQHEFTGEAGLVTLMAGAANIASYYTGPDTGLYLILMLTSEEDGDLFEEGLSEAAGQIVENIDETKLRGILPSIFQRLSVYPTMDEEQNLAALYQNKVKRMILDRLREVISIPKSEIVIWIKDQFKDGFVDIESVISSMTKRGVVKLASVKGVSSDTIFLAQDIMMLRIPPKNLILDPVDRHLPESLKDAYLTDVRNFFLGYKPSIEDSLDIINLIYMDPPVYETYKLLREAIVTKNDLEKLKKKGVDDVDYVLKALWKSKMIAVFKDDKNTEYFCLVSDFVIERFFPRYALDKLRKEYRTQAQNPKVLLKSLEMMKNEF